MTTIDFERAVKKPFTDTSKLIVGIFFSITPIIHWISKGFVLECSGLGKTKSSKKMPEFKNWKYLFINGFLADMILLMYAIPAILVFLYGIVTLGGLTRNIAILSSENIMQLFSQNWYLALPIIVQLAPILLAGFIFLLIAFYITPMAVLNFLKTKKFSEAFRLSKIMKKILTLDYLVVWIFTTVISGMLTIILLVIPWFGPRISIFITGIIAYSLYGDVYRKIR